MFALARAHALEPVAHLCASLQFTPREKRSFEFNDTMKTQIFGTAPQTIRQSPNETLTMQHRRPFGGKTSTWIAILGAAALIALLTGCASTGSSGDANCWQYNPTTGYPAVGGPPWRSI